VNFRSRLLVFIFCSQNANQMYCYSHLGQMNF
jgi:hypothetical protein